MIWTTVPTLTLGGFEGGMSLRLTSGAHVALRIGLAVTMVCAFAARAPEAYAVVARGNLAVTVAPNTVLSTATYTIGSFRTGNNDSVTGYTLTFQADTDASGATSPGVGDLVSVSPDGLTVAVTLGTPIGERTTFGIVLGNIVNPSVAGTYAIGSVTFHRPAGDQTVTLGTNGQYTIADAPYVSMTITTPDPGQSLDFGLVDPGETTLPKVVSVEVMSSAAYTVTRTVTGDGALLGLEVNGSATLAGLVGTGLAGTTTFADQYTVTPPWTTDPEAQLAASITYTVTQ